MEKLSILIIEDNRERIRMLEELYRNQDITISRSHDEAVDRLLKFRYDIISLDYDLSGEISGAEVAKRIKSNPNHSIVLIHSENPVGSIEIQSILPNSIRLPITQLVSRNRFSDRLKALLCMPAKDKLESIEKLLRRTQEENIS